MKWKPANSKSAILAVQKLIATHPYDFEFRRLFYYVTKQDIAQELGRPQEEIMLDEIDVFFKEIGLGNAKVFSAGIADEPTYGFFVDELTLSFSKLELLPWNFSQTKPKNARSAEVKNKSKNAIFSTAP